MKKYGIYLAYAPEQDIRNQGLGRLLAFIISGAIDNQTPLVLAYPKWYEEEIKKLCEDQHIDFKQIEKITTNSVPILIRLKSMVEQFGKRKKKQSSILVNLLKISFNAIGKLAIRWLGMSNLFVFLITGVVFLSLFLMLLPVMFVITVSAGLLFVAKKSLRKILGRGYMRVVSAPLRNLRRNMFAHKVFDLIRHQELQRLNTKINQKKDVNAWLIPTLFWPEIESIQAKKVVVAPDIIFYDFPTHFNTPIFARTNKKLMHTIAHADHFITYSRYVKENHLQKPFGIVDEKISVVAHGYSDLSNYLFEQDSLSILQSYQKEKLQSNRYLADFSIKDMRYIFYSSQIRPHKNFLNLLKAYKILLRERFINVKLVTTANLSHDPEVRDYIQKYRLQNDVLSLRNVPSKVLAVLNARAICAINPTLFEGGFPFTFLEAYTVGTPSIMGDIPMTTEMIHDVDLKKVMLFDPFSVQSMVEKIEWGVQNHDELFKMQEKLYLQMKQRSWADAAADYIKVLENVSA